MNTVVHDHRTHQADNKIGSYLELKTRALGLGRPAPTASLAQLIGDADHKSIVVAEPDQPKGFGLTVHWDGDEDLAVVGFVVTTDEYGIAVSGVTDADTFEVINAVGTATFTQEKSNEGVASLVTIVAAGAGLGAAAFGASDLVGPIKAVGDALAKAFPESQHPAKPRDAYGADPGSGKFGRQEGGMLVCGPDAQGIYHSGNDDHQDRWAKSDKDRSDDHVPAHCQHAFFVQRDNQQRPLDGDGTMIIAPWDYKFPDNIGVYRLEFILRRGVRPDVP